MLQLFWVELFRCWRAFIRYPVDALALIFVMLFMFYGLFWGAEYLAGGIDKFGDRLQSIVIFYITWILVISVFSGVSAEIQREADTGTLEQLFIARVSLPGLIFIRALANLGVNATITLVTLGLVVIGTDVELVFPPAVLVPFVGCILGGIGLGMLVGSITLLAKRTIGLIGILQLGLLFFVTLPIGSWSGSSRVAAFLLPLTPNSYQIKQMMSGQVATLSLDHAYAFVNGFIYLLLGYCAFHLATQRARRFGLLSQH